MGSNGTCDQPAPPCDQLKLLVSTERRNDTWLAARPAHAHPEGCEPIGDTLRRWGHGPATSAKEPQWQSMMATFESMAAKRR